MIHHFINLLTRAWVLCVVWMGTSTLAVVVAVVIFLIVVAVGLWKNRSDWRAAMRSTLVAAAVTVGVWLLLYASAIVATVYQDHVFLVSENQDNEGEMARLQGENEDLRKAPKALSIPLQDSHKTEDQIGQPGKNLTKVADRCWYVNYFGLANSTVKGAVTATTVIIHCNHKVEAPYEVRVGFDRPFIIGNTTVPDGGVQMGSVGAEGLVFKATLNPSLLADQTLTVTVFGLTGEYPRAGGVIVKSLD